jgi:hypothetical protein
MHHEFYIPRPEYPRPDRQRGRIEGIDWLNLNGPWQFQFDPEKSGVERNWHALNGPDWGTGQIIVPFCWESLAAWGEADTAGNDNYYSTRPYINPVEVTRENHRSARRYEVGWYRREVRIPSHGAWRDKRVILTIGASDFFTDCWCNGIHIGSHEGGYVPFEFDITDALAEEEPNGIRTAMLVIRVEDPMDNHEQPVGKQWRWYTTTSGIWQTVFVEPRGASHVDYFRVIPDIDLGHVLFEVFCVGLKPDSEVFAEIIPPCAPAFTIPLHEVNGVAVGDAEIHPVTLWDTGDPKLYHVVFRIFDPGGLLRDEVRSYFGMRKISTAPASQDDAPAMLCLNNKPIYLRGALYQSYYPEGVYTALDAKTLRNDISFAIEAGFDFLRIHIKLDDPLLLYYADTLGILLMQDFPNFGEGGDTPLGRRRFEEMMREGFKRDFNHPSIISWCIFNETWGFGGQTELIKMITPDMSPVAIRKEAEKVCNSSSFRWVHEMWNLAKSLDSTRLIEDMSVVVWEHLAAYGHVDTDINSWHFYIDDYEKARKHIEDVVAKTYHGSTFNYIEGYSQRNVPLINSEYGGVGALDGDRDVSWTFKFLTNELRRHGQLSAYIYTELMDVEWENNGFLNYDRTRKEFGYATTLINQGDVLPISAPPVERLDPGSEVEIEVLSSHFSRRRRDAVTFQWMYSGMDTVGNLYPSLHRGHCRIPFRHHRVELAKRLSIQLPEIPMLCTLSVAAVAPDGKLIASNFIQHFVSSAPAMEREEDEVRIILRRRVQDWDVAQWSGGHSSREESTSEGLCHGGGVGYYDWVFSDDALEHLSEARRILILLEASTRRDDTPQTDPYRHASSFVLSANGLPILRNILPDHPHDTRGALSYLRGGRGAYGYLLKSTIENGMLEAVSANSESPNVLRLRTEVTGNPAGGLTVYDSDCGRFPVAPTLIIEWGEAHHSR